ncbi:MAG: DUF86 domain-containing protein [Deltaproteobacteria bacterium]|nr:DUF86 domain-containing protein [Deltaproteobacteria bacterium]
MPWKELRGIRNVYAHRYGSLDLQLVRDSSKYVTKTLKKIANMFSANLRVRNNQNKI